MKNIRAIGRMVIIGIIIVIIVIAGVVGYYLTLPMGPKIKDTLVMGTTDSIESCLDPSRAYDYFGWEIIRSLGSGLVDYRPGATGAVEDIIPDLATSWTVTSNGLEWTFTLRQGVQYDDGTVFNATHVKYTFDRAIEMADPDGAFVGIGFSDIIQSVTVVDAYTVKFTLKIPFGAFLSLIAGQECVMVDPKYAPMQGTSWNYTTDTILYTEGNARASNPMGLGPYTLSNWTRTAGKDSQMVLVANPNYWNASAGIPKTKNMIIKFYADSTGLALAVQAGEIDIAFRQLGTTDINSMKNNANLHVWQGTGAFIQYLCLQEKYWPFNETKIRQAIGAAINRSTIVNTVFQGQAQSLFSLIPIGMSGHTDAFQNLGDPNYTRTRELLAEFGFNETNKLTFKLWYETSGHYPQSLQQAQVLKSSLEASGVLTVNLDGLDWPGYRSARQNEAMEAFIMGWYPDYIDADDYIYPFLHSSGGSWIHINYADPTMDQLIEWARGNTTASTRNSLYSQVQDLAVTDSPIIPLYQGAAYAVTSLKVKGVYLDITQNWRHWLVYAEA
jgi:peptide/nickel transport system substrate-binding protein